MFLYRALNELDIKLDPIKHGIYNKKIIKMYIDARRDYLNRYPNEYGDMGKCLNDTDLLLGDVYDYLNEFRDEINDDLILKFEEEINNPLSHSKKFIKDLNIYAHILKGSKYDYEWISTSKNFKSILKYYWEQSTPSVAVIESDLKIDLESLLILDLSSDESIEKYHSLLSEDDYLNLKSTAFYFTKVDDQVIFFNYIPQDKIVTVLDQFEYDLLYNGMYDEKVMYDIIRKSHFNKAILNIKTNIYNELRNSNKDKILELFTKMYIKNISLKELSKEYELDYLKEIKKIILSSVKKENNVGIKLEKTKDWVILPEDKKTSYGR